MFPIWAVCVFFFSCSLGKPIFPCQRVTARWGKLDCPERSCDLEGNIDIMPNRWHGQEIAWTFYPTDDLYTTNRWALEQYQGDKKENSGLRADIYPYASVVCILWCWTVGSKRNECLMIFVLCLCPSLMSNAFFIYQTIPHTNPCRFSFLCNRLMSEQFFYNITTRSQKCGPPFWGEEVSSFLHELLYNNTWVRSVGAKKFLDFNIVVFSFLFIKHCPILEEVGLKDSPRDL